MIIKTITAESVASALKKVRSELGPQAVVLKTRQLENRLGAERIEITACIDKPLEAEVQKVSPETRTVTRATFNRVSNIVPAAKPAQSTPRTNVESKSTVAVDRIEQLERKLDQLLAQSAGAKVSADNADNTTSIRQKLSDADVPASVVEKLLGSLNAESDESSVRTALMERLADMMIPSLTFKPGDRVVFVGMAGSGKTSAMGKLAARLVFQEHLKTTLVTIDNVKVGAIEEIESYGDILGAPVLELSAQKKSFDPKSVTLIDTPALPTSADRLESVRATIESLKPTHSLLVFSSLTRSSDMADLMERVKAFAPTNLIMTMLDVTDRWGALMAAHESSNLQLAFVTNSPAGIGTLNAPDPALFVRTLLNAEVCLE